MDMHNTKRGNLLITYLFNEDNDVVKNIDNEQIMRNDLSRLVNSWEEKGYINRFIIAPDEVIDEKLKNQLG